MKTAVSVPDDVFEKADRLARATGRSRSDVYSAALSEFVFADPDVLEEGGMLKNTANTHVVRHADRTFALMEAAPPTQVDPVTLETLGEHDFGGRLQGPMTAHPKLDPDTGEMLFFGYSPFPPYVVPDDHLWLMGDNRGSSDDSRRFKGVPMDDVVGRAFVVIWPPDALDTL